MNMRIKISVLFLMAFLSAPALAQQPRIDGISVDEDKGELIVKGLFQNPTSAVVFIDSVSLYVTFTSDTFIRATIPLKGKGSAGWVQVNVGALESNNKLLTYIHYFFYFSGDHIYSDGGEEFQINADTLH